LLVSAGLLLNQGSFAGTQIIPIAQDEAPGDNNSFAQTIIKVFQTDIIPVIEIFSAVWILYTGITTMANGVKEAQERQKFDPLKNAIIKTVVIVVVGGILIYLMDQLRTFRFVE
jgi:hypothetical protein